MAHSIPLIENPNSSNGYSPDAYPGAAVALLVDADDDFRYILDQMLMAIGYDVVHADDADDARRLAATIRPALIITDVRTRLHDPRVLPLELRREPAMAAVPMIVCNSWVYPGDRDLARSAGADLFMTVPVDFRTIREFAATVLARRGTEVAHAW
jgi:DNA-binding response OmpR family regulator